jgi:ABC-2 type transport system permease protein
VADLRGYAAVAGAAVRTQAGRPLYLAGRVATSGLIQLGELAGFLLVVGRFGGLAGWPSAGIAMLWGLGLIGQGLAQTVTVRLDPADFGALVGRGEFDQVLLRPVGALGWMLATSLDLRFLGRAACGVVVVVWAGHRAGIAWTPFLVAVAAMGALCCAAIIVAVLVVSAAFTLRTAQGSELANIFSFGGVFLTGFPMEIYGGVLRFAFTWVMPLALAVYVPALVLLGRPGVPGLTPALLALAPVSAAAFAALAGLAWRAGLRGYLGTGS